MQGQAIMSFADRAPHLYEHGKLHRMLLDGIGVENAAELVPLPEDMIPMDPVSENMAVLRLDPVKAFQHQDHQSHIAVHMMAMQDPKIQQVLAQSPTAQQSMSAMMTHVTEHVAWEYRSQIEQNLGVQLPPPDEALPPEIEVQLSSLVAQAARQLFGRNQQEISQQEAEAKAKDPIQINRERELAIAEKEAQSKAAQREGQLMMEMAKLLQRDESETRSLHTQREMSAERTRAEILGDMLDSASENAKLSYQERIAVADQYMKRIREDTDRIKAQNKVQIENDKMDLSFFQKASDLASKEYQSQLKAANSQSMPKAPEPEQKEE